VGFKHTCSASCELHITSLHAKKVIAFSALLSLLDHAIPMCQFAAEDIAEDFGISMRMGWEALASIYSIFVQNPQTSKVLEARIVVISETEGMVAVEPSVVCVSALVGAAGHDFGVREGFGHGVFDCGYSAHGV